MGLLTGLNGERARTGIGHDLEMVKLSLEYKELV